jgi:hypothetical protein
MMEFTRTWGGVRIRQIWSGFIAETHSRNTLNLCISPDFPPDKDVDVFEGYSFNDRQPIVIAEEEGVPGKEKPEGTGKDGEFNPENRRPLAVTTSPRGQLS